MSEVTMTQVLCMAALGFQNFELASILGFTSQALTSMNDDPNMHITDEQSSWVGAAIPLAALVGSIFGGPLVEMFGCKYVATVTEIPAISAWVYLSTANTALEIVICRLISGFCLGIMQVALNVYSSETVHPKIRPKLEVIPAVFITTGFLLINVCGIFTDWRGMARYGVVSCLPCFLSLLFLLPNSPYYSLKRGNGEETLNTLIWLHSSKKFAEEEFKEIKESEKSQKPSSGLGVVFQIPYRWPVTIALILHVTQQLSGMNPLVAFTSIIFARAKSSVDAGVASMANALINLITSIFVLPLYAKYPRKLFIKISSQIMVVSLVSLSLYFWVLDITNPNNISHSILTYIPSICLSFFTFGIGVGWGPIPWVFISEGLPLKVRGIGAGIISSVNWGFNFLTTKSFLWTTVNWGYGPTFLFYAVSLIIGSSLAMHSYPETFGYQNSDLERYYKNLYVTNKLEKKKS